MGCRGSQPAAVPVDNPRVIAAIEQNVAHVEIRVVSARVMAPADDGANPLPGLVGHRPVAQAVIKRFGVRNGGGDEVCAIHRPPSPYPGGHRCGHRQPLSMQSRQQTILPERPGLLAPRPAIDIPGKTRDDAPAPVVAQHQGLARPVDEPGTAAARAGADDQAFGGEGFGVEEPQGQGIHDPGIVNGMIRAMVLHNLVVHNRPVPFAEPPERLCLFRLSAIGDCCHLVPVVRTLQAAWPDTRLTWIIGRTEAALLGDLEGVECITFDKRAGRGALRRQLSGRAFDGLLLMQVALRAGWASTAVRAPLRLGFDRGRSKDFHGLFVNRRVAPHPRAHVMDGFFGFIEALGVRERQLRWDIPVPAEAREYAESLVPDDQPTLLISPCSSQRFNNFRNWPAERYAIVAREAVRRHGMRVILTGGPSDEERAYAEAIKAGAGVPVMDCIGRTSLKELFAILQRATVLISPDSGPVHMAVAAGTPVIGLYATSNPHRSGPYLGREWVVNRYPEAVRAAFGCGVEALPWGRRVRQPDAMERIETDAVLERLDALLKTPVADRLAVPPASTAEPRLP